MDKKFTGINIAHDATPKERSKSFHIVSKTVFSSAMWSA